MPCQNSCNKEWKLLDASKMWEAVKIEAYKKGDGQKRVAEKTGLVKNRDDKIPDMKNAHLCDFLLDKCPSEFNLKYLRRFDY